MLSAVNLLALEESGFAFIVDSRISTAPDDLAEHFRTKGHRRGLRCVPARILLRAAPRVDSGRDRARAGLRCRTGSRKPLLHKANVCYVNQR